MRKNYILFGLLFIAVTTIYSCSKDIDLQSVEQKNIQSAREIFRSEYLKAVETMVQDTLPAGEYNPADYEKSLYEGYKLQPGEFTPRWDGASDNKSEVSVSILPTFDYLAILYKNKSEIGSIGELPVFPKLIVDLKSSSCYIAYIIPTPEFYAENTDVHNHFKTKDMDFCGIVMNYDLKGNLLDVEKYVDGKLKDKADKQTFTGTDDEYYDRVYKMSGCHYNMGRAVCISTKGSGEGNPGSPYNRTLTSSQISNLGSNLGSGEMMDLYYIFGGNAGSVKMRNFTMVVNGVRLDVYQMEIYCTDYTISTYGGQINSTYTNSYDVVGTINGVQYVRINFGPSYSSSREYPSMQIVIPKYQFDNNMSNFLFGR